MKIMKKAVCVLILSIIIVGVIGSGASAQTDNRAANIKSRGNIDFDNGAAYICAGDLTYLAQEIDVLEYTYKTKTVDALAKVGTYYKADGTTTYDREEDTMQPEDASNLSFDALATGIKNSQNIPEITYSGILPGTNTETSGTIYASTADNLALGSAAWVEGELIIGTGRDNDAFYQLGYADGIADKFNAKIEYAYHEHTGSPTDGGGCHTKPVYHKHDSSCYTRKTGQLYAVPCDDTCGICGQHVTWDAYKCNICGVVLGDGIIDGHPTHRHPEYSVSEHGRTHDCGNILTCGQTDVIIGWDLGCGKTTSTIVSATIVFP